MRTHPAMRLIARYKSIGWSEALVLSSALMVCVSVWMFLALASFVAHDAYLQQEEHWLRLMRRVDNPAIPIGPPWLAELGRDLSALGGATVVILLSLFILGYLVLRADWRAAILLGVTVLGGYLLSSTLKLAYARERPEVVPHLAFVESASFPSGHSLSSSVVYLTIGALLAQRAARRREKVYFVAAALVLTFLVGVSRIFLGVHYPTDVVAGWSAGTGWALGCWLVGRWFLRRRPATGGVS